MQSAVSKSQYPTDVGESTEETPLPPQHRDFIMKSRKIQTLYTNSDGFFSRRVFRHNQKDLLHEFITTLVFDNCIFGDVKRNGNPSLTWQCVEKIIHRGRQFNSVEVHLALVWIHYYDYNERRDGCWPVFKIYTASTGNEAVFLDFGLKEYISWDRVIDTVELPESLMCVPQGGKYRFREGRLLLEFVHSMRLRTSLACKRTYEFAPSIFQWVKKPGGWGEVLLQQAKNIAEFYEKHKTTIKKIFFMLLELVIRIQKFDVLPQSSSSLVRSAPKIIDSLQNLCGHEFSAEQEITDIDFRTFTKSLLSNLESIGNLLSRVLTEAEKATEASPSSTTCERMIWLLKILIKSLSVD